VNSDHLRLNILISRFISPGISFPGTAGSYESLKRPSRISAGIPACLRIGIGLSVIRLPLSHVCDSDRCIDAPDFYESSFWKDSDPVSGLGGWGDPNADFEVPDGGFHAMPLSYPSPHTLRRNFTLQPYIDGSFPLWTDPQKIGNASFAAAVVEAVLGTPAGDYKGFHTALETPEVRKMNMSSTRLDFSSVTQGPHAGVHTTVGA
jgi:hypothetical protein